MQQSPKCSACGGIGEDLSAGSSINAMDYLPCGKCHGSGRVGKPTDKEQIEAMKAAIRQLDDLFDLSSMYLVHDDLVIVINTIDVQQVVEVMITLKSFITEETHEGTA